jgi:hypothetical protein
MGRQLFVVCLILVALPRCTPGGGGGTSGPPALPVHNVCSFAAGVPALSQPPFAASAIQRVWGAVREGPLPTDTWSLLSSYPRPRIWPATPTIRAAADIKEVAVSGATVAGGREVHLLVVRDPSVTTAPSKIDDFLQTYDGAWANEFRLDDQVCEVPFVFEVLGACRPTRALFSRVSAAAVNGELEVIAVTQTPPGRLERAQRKNGTFRSEAARWTEWADIGDAVGRSFVDAAAASVFRAAVASEELHVCAVTDDGRLWHAMSPAGAPFVPLSDVETVAGEVGQFVKVDCAGGNEQLQVIGVTSDGGAWYTIRNPSGNWRPFASVKTAMSPGPTSFLGNIVDVAAGFCRDDGPSAGTVDVPQLSAVLRTDTDSLLYTIHYRTPQPERFGGGVRTWREFQDLRALMGAGSVTGWSGLSVGARPFPPHAFRIDSVSPTQVTRGQRVTLTVTGEGFLPATVFTFRGGGDLGMSNQAVTVDSVHRVRISIDIAATAGRGGRDLSATQMPGGLETSGGTFTVQ